MGCVDGRSLLRFMINSLPLISAVGMVSIIWSLYIIHRFRYSYYVMRWLYNNRSCSWVADMTWKVNVYIAFLIHRCFHPEFYLAVGVSLMRRIPEISERVNRGVIRPVGIWMIPLGAFWQMTDVFVSLVVWPSVLFIEVNNICHSH